MSLKAVQQLPVVRGARSWVSTPYHHAARVKGAGVDCAKILIEVFSAAGVIAWFDPGPYPPDWHLHRSEERYVEIIERFAAEIPVADLDAGDVVVWQYGRTFSHGGIVTGEPGREDRLGWPWFVHAFALYACVAEDTIDGSPLQTMNDGVTPRPMRAFRPRAWL